MAYINKVPAAAAVATAVLFLMLTIAPQWTEAQLPPMPKVNPLCAFANVPNTVQLCYLSGNLVPSEECCNDLKSASTAQVTCLCDNIIANPSNANFTRALFDAVHTVCGVQEKFACKGSTNGGATNKIAVSIGLFGLVASLFF